MDFGNQPVDYASIIGQGQKLAFNPLDAQQQSAQTGLLNAQTQQQQALVQAAQQKQQRFAQFQTAIHTYDGSATSASKLIAQFPEYADQLKASWDLQDNARKQSDLTELGQIYSAASGGNWDLAKKLAHQRADAEKANGYSDPTYDAALGIMDKAADGDPTQQKVVLNLLGTHLAAVTGPDHFGTVYGALKGDDKGFTLDAGATRYDSEGKVVAQSPYLKGADGTVYERNAEGGGPASGGGATGGVQASVAHVLGNEGGLNPSDMNGSPTNFGINYSANKPELAKLGITSPGQMGNLTKDQAAQIYAAKYWPQSGADKLPANLQAPYFDVYVRSPALAKKALKDSGGDPAKFAQITSTAFQTMAANNPKAAPYAKAWATRDAGNAAIATGQAPAADSGAQPSSAPAGYHVLTPGNSSPNQYRTLTPAEVKQRGLDPAQQYQLNSKTGQLTGLGKIDAGDQPVPGNANLSGPAYLASVPPNLATQVKALAEGRLPMPSSFALAKPYWQRLLQMTAQYDPTFDAASAPARKAAITAFTGNGRAAQVVGSVNRVANHLQLLWNESQRLAGPETGFGPLNSLLATGGQAFEPADAKAYDGEVGFVAGELEKIARNSPGTESGVERIISNLGRRNSTKTRASAIKAAVGIISGAVDPLKDQYNSAFTNGSTRPNIPWVSPRAQEIYKNIGGVDMSLTGANADSNNTSASRQPPAGATRTATGPNGQKAALVNGSWVQY